MKNYKRSILLFAACALVGLNASAQDDGFDLDSQRSESQSVLPVPGHKVDHGGLVINPTPQYLELVPGARLAISEGFNVKDKQGKFADALGFITHGKHGVKLTIDFGAKVSSKHGVEQRSGAYAMTVGQDGVSIVGYDERGAFYGIQTLRQIFGRPVASGGEVPCMTINDYPDLPYRGVVEGFYGNPWSHEVRMSLIDFYGQNKMDTYLYGPKDDPYHSSPNWRLPYPEEEARHLTELVQACRHNRVDFVWAIHPGKDIKWNEEDYQNLVHKFNLMYDLGVRSFAIFFDDISGEGTNPVKQVELLNRLTDDFVKAKGDVSSLIVCPTDYSRLWAKPGPDGALSIYGKTLDPSIKVFWTGDVVCSDLTRETLDWINSRIRRPAYYWWNYPVTDYVRNIILQGPVYGLDTTLTDDNLCGFVSNPMEHGEASKLALYGVADYAWNVADYNAIDNWERGLEALMPGAAEAYRTFAIHSADTETGYRRDESWETATFTLDTWTDDRADRLYQEFEEIEKVPAAIADGCTNRALYSELRPWLTEFGKLGTRGKRTIDLMRAYRSGVDGGAFWNAYIANLMTSDDRAAYEAHKSGTMKLQPFYETAMDDMAHAFMTTLMGTAPMRYRGIGSFPNASTTLTKLMFDNDSVSHYTSGMAQGEGDWIGVDLGGVFDVHEVDIHQGRNSVDDVDYFDHVVLESSTDGKVWRPLTPGLEKYYDINWSGDTIKARYVRLRRLASAKTNYAAVRSFVVNPVRLDNLGFTLEADDAEGALMMFDKRLDTSCKLDGAVTFTTLAGTARYTILTGSLDGAAVTVRQFAADGTVLAETTFTDPFIQFDTIDGAARMTVEGRAEVFEIIPQR